VTVVAVLAALAATALAGLRWLRVAQREHYLAGSVVRFAGRWWGGLGPNRLLAVAVVFGVLGTLVRPFAGLVAAAAVAVGPFGLRLVGRSPGPLAWTRRMRTLAAVWAALQLLVILIGALLGRPVLAAAAGAAAVPLLVDAALALTRPIEDRLAQQFVDAARSRLRSVRPTVVAITGSYGKTSTKGYVAHLVGSARTVSASPRSFNNRAGLARAVNESLAPGTDVFVAEMGTYGPGEIAELCEWVQPSISVITAIGPVHLERFGTEDRIVEAKSEIFATAQVAVLNIDDPRLAAVADRLEAEGKRVIRCRAADVEQFLGDSEAPATNVACAVAVALELGVPRDAVLERIRSLPTAPNRLTTSTGAGGFTILDDTYNSNPAGVRRALAQLERAGGARRVVVTPGMVELGPRQRQENAEFARQAAKVATDLVVVGHTNRAALLEGASGTGLDVVLVEDREAAVDWVKDTLGPGDAVLYENDLPDHFP
jgi:UDP-N-acetylmuramoyl-tripeptide--D-alanyl-D-alanine ligase